VRDKSTLLEPDDYNARIERGRGREKKKKDARKDTIMKNCSMLLVRHKPYRCSC
jgi:hypothetical protein